MTRIRLTVKAVDNGKNGLKMSIPKDIRNALNIKSGDYLDIELELGANHFIVKKQGADS